MEHDKLRENQHEHIHSTPRNQNRLPSRENKPAVFLRHQEVLDVLSNYRPFNYPPTLIEKNLALFKEELRVAPCDAESLQKNILD
jgi:hypothetical protein